MIVPGWSSSGEDHWQTRWQRSLRTARRVEQGDWVRPNRDKWVGTLISTIAKIEGDLPLVIVAHSLGVATLAHAARELPAATIAGAFLVAPSDVDRAATWPVTEGCMFDAEACGFAPMPVGAMPFPSHVIASSNDPYCSLARAKALAQQWGATLSEAGDAGHINIASGHGPWPEGLMQLGWFLKRIGEERQARARPH